jgi:hypothetical protein
MLVFPQLMSGAVAQLPSRRDDTYRTNVNTLADGSVVRSSDDAARGKTWELELRDLSDSEAGALLTLFDSAEGRLTPFTFLDPADNLLAWSEDFDRSCWLRGATIQLQPGVADPLGGTAATRLTNAGQSAQGLSQRLEVPGEFQFCFSIYARAASLCAVTMWMLAGQARLVTAYEANSNWQRISVSGIAGTGEEVTFGLDVGAGSALELFGAQVDAHPGSSLYRKTLSRGGVYPNTKFATDEIAVQAQGPNRNTAVIRMASPAGA